MALLRLPASAPRARLRIARLRAAAAVNGVAVRRAAAYALAASGGVAASGQLRPRQSVTLVRHGQTEMNEWLRKNRWDAPNFVDPGLYDTRLTEEGRSQARRLGLRTAAFASVEPPPELIVSSPLSRALATAELGLPRSVLPSVPRVVCALCRERLYHSSDVGRPPAVVAAEFPGWDGFGGLEDVWWHAPCAEGECPDPLAHEPEPEAVFLARVAHFLAWLRARPERRITVVSHWGVIDALTQIEFANCEHRTFDVSTLTVRRPAELVPPG